LLPPPVAAGPRSYYSEIHLQRLRLIGFMKDAFLPLREIRRRLQELGDDEIEDAIAEFNAERGEENGQLQLDRQPETRYEIRESAIPQTPELPREPLEPQTWPFIASQPNADPVRQEPAWRLPRPIKSARHEPHNSTVWRKLEIGESAEFLIEERLYQRRKEQVDALVVWAQRILDGTQK
jgi:DNA-binding transcriptional MerR regulator